MWEWQECNASPIEWHDISEMSSRKTARLNSQHCCFETILSISVGQWSFTRFRKLANPLGHNMIACLARNEAYSISLPHSRAKILPETNAAQATAASMRPNPSLKRTLHSVPAFGPSFHSGPIAVPLFRAA